MKSINVILILFAVIYIHSSVACKCNKVSKKPMKISDLPNPALKIARLSLDVLKGLSSRPHLFALVMGSMYDAYGFKTNRKRLTSVKISTTCTSSELVPVVGISMLREYVSSPVQVSMIDKFVSDIGISESKCGNVRPFISGIMNKFKMSPVKNPDLTPPNPASSKPRVAECNTIKDPDGWQPLCMSPRNSPSKSCKRQEVGRSTGLLRAPLISSNGKPYSGVLAKGFKTPTSNVPLNKLFNTNGGYVREYRDLMKITSKLNDYRKTVAEYFSASANDRFLGFVIDDLAIHKSSLAQSVRVLFTVTGSMRDALVTVFTMKLETAVIRPITVIQCGMNGKRRSIWKPYRGIQRNVKLSFDQRWEPYLNTPSSASYPSGHTSIANSGVFAYMLAVGWRKPKVSNCFVQKAGGSKIDGMIKEGERGFIDGVTNVPNKGMFSKGFVPGKNVTICWGSWSKYAELTALSRVYGGIHTRKEVSTSRVIGRRAARRMIRYINNLKK